MRTIAAGVAVAVAALALLAACAAEPGEPEPSRPAATGSAASPEPSATAVVPRVFRMPERCTDLLPATTLADFASDELELLGGPGSDYGTDYFSEPTPEQRAGGITCVWGDESDSASTVIVSVAPVSAATRSGIVDGLIAQGLNEAEVDGALTYAVVGDAVSSPGILNVVRDDSWISVIEAVGGEERFQRATALVDEVTAQVYVPA
jgi:hypothetical protein